jgi:hypothetical protein
VQSIGRMMTGILAAASAATAAGAPALDVGGLLFGDLYYVPSHHLASGDGAAGAVLRRAYLTFDADFDAAWFGRLRFEWNQSGEFETYSIDGQTKDLYLGRRLGPHRALLGLSPTPTFDLVESIWGLRYVERTPLDLQGVPSRDTGLAAAGPLNAADTLRYRGMYAAPVDFGSDGDHHERWMGAITWLPAAGWTVDAYADYQALDGPHDRSTWQVFVARQSEGRRWGILYANQDRQADPSLELVSAFVVRDLGPRHAWFLRADRLIEPSPRGDGIAYLPMDPSAPATMFFGGVEFRLSETFRLTPDVVLTRYDHNDAGVRPRADLHLRLTLFLDFE